MLLVTLVSSYLKYNNIAFKVGDIIKVYQRLIEGEKERTQLFEGLVIKIKGHQGEKTFTVRKIAQGVGVEKIFPIDSPFIKKIEVKKEGIVRRAKLYYLRNREGRLALKVKQDFGINDNKKNTTKNPKPPKKESGKTGRTADKKETSSK